MSQVDHEELEIAPRQKHQVVRWLEQNTQALLDEIQQQDFWKFLMSPDSDAKSVGAVMREVYSEIVGYQPNVIEAAIAAIGQMPRSVDPRLIKSMLLHQGDEFDHGEMALRDLIGLGVSEAAARHKRISPEAFAVAGVWWMIVQARTPFAYLGALYMFEGLTPTVTGMVKSKLQAKGMGARSLEYIEFHSTEDIKHANLVNHLISTVADQHPESVDDIKHGFDCFRFVYPIPLWAAAFKRSGVVS